MSVPIVEGLLKVITEGIKYLTLLSKTSHVRRLRRAVDWGEKFIITFDELVSTDDVKEKRKLRTRLNYIRKRFFRYNQG